MDRRKRRRAAQPSDGAVRKIPEPSGDPRAGAAAPDALIPQPQTPLLPIGSALADLQEVVRLGLARGASLLTAGELRFARLLSDLDGPEGTVYARLAYRVRTVFCVDTLAMPGVPDVHAAVDGLVMRGLAHRTVSPKDRAAASTREHLAARCRALGLSTAGRKRDLVERVAAIPTWDDRAWVALMGRGLIRRLERFAFLAAAPDRGVWVAARLGHVRWPSYPLTTGPGLFRDRRALRAWEGLLDPLDPEDALRALAERTGRAPGRLDRTRALVEAVRVAARGRERADPAGAACLYERLIATGEVRLGVVAVRWARALERAGAPQEALAVLQRAQLDPRSRPSEQVAIGRSGRRVARALRTTFLPHRPPDRARVRELRVPPAPPHRGKPRWMGPEGPDTIEQVVVGLVRAHGRIALRAEGAPWSTLFAFLFAEAYFLPIPGTLPVPLLAGPLDLGTPAFREARTDACAAVLTAVQEGRAADLVAERWASWAGVRLRGARWERTTLEALLAIAAAAPPRGLAVLLDRLLDRGPRASAGLPDLIVLPGPEVRLESAFPRRLAPELTLVEVKGPTDTLRDEQIIWHDTLVRAGWAVEVWWVQ